MNGELPFVTTVERTYGARAIANSIMYYVLGNFKHYSSADKTSTTTAVPEILHKASLCLSLKSTVVSELPKHPNDNRTK